MKSSDFSRSALLRLKSTVEILVITLRLGLGSKVEQSSTFHVTTEARANQIMFN